MSLLAPALLSLLLSLTPAARAQDGVHAPPPDEADPAAQAPAAVPQGWTLVEPPLAIPGPSTPPPPPPPTPQPPPGWREVIPPAGRAPAAPGVTTRPADARVFAVGGVIGGGATMAVDGLLRLSPTVVADMGIGPQVDVRTWQPRTTRVLLGLTWQPGQRTARHGLVLRGGLGFTEHGDGPSEAALLGGYAWRLVPRHAATTFELETGPALFVVGLDDPLRDWVGLAFYGRAGVHFWMR